MKLVVPELLVLLFALPCTESHYPLAILRASVGQRLKGSVKRFHDASARCPDLSSLPIRACETNSKPRYTAVRK
jgi:hypothetical protein